MTADDCAGNKLRHREFKIRYRRPARTLTLVTVPASGPFILVWAVTGRAAVPATLGNALLIVGLLLTARGLLDLLSWAPGLDRDGEPLELRDATRHIGNCAAGAGGWADPARRGAALAESIYGDAVALCELNARCGLHHRPPALRRHDHLFAIFPTRRCATHLTVITDQVATLRPLSAELEMRYL